MFNVYYTTSNFKKIQKIKLLVLIWKHQNTQIKFDLHVFLEKNRSLSIVSIDCVTDSAVQCG